MPLKHNGIGKGYDLVAPVYDFVVSIFFQKKIQALIDNTLQSLPPKKTALIIGGGTGKILVSIAKRPLVDKVFYAELSHRMLDLTKKRMANEETQIPIKFQTDWTDFDEQAYDYIILPFVLDCYEPEEIQSLIIELKKKLDLKGSLILFDFNAEENFGYQPNWIKGQFIQLLYSFFKAIGATHTMKLAPFNAIIMACGFDRLSEATIYNGWIQAVIFSKA